MHTAPRALRQHRRDERGTVGRSRSVARRLGSRASRTKHGPFCRARQHVADVPMSIAQRHRRGGNLPALGPALGTGPRTRVTASCSAASHMTCEQLRFSRWHSRDAQRLWCKGSRPGSFASRPARATRRRLAQGSRQSARTTSDPRVSYNRSDNGPRGYDFGPKGRTAR